MDVSKKAKKLTKLIASQLKDALEDGCGKKEMENSFKEAVRSIKKKEIQSEIECNIKKYFKKFEKFLKEARHDNDNGRVKESFPVNMYAFENQDTIEVNAHNSEEQRKIVYHLIAEKIHIQPDLINLLEGLPSSATDFPQLSKFHQALMLLEKTNSETLTYILLHYFRAVQSLTDDIFKSPNSKRIEEMVNEMKGFICIFHLRRQGCTKCEESSKLTYHDILASLLSIYTDLVVLSHRSDEDPKKAGKKLCGYVAYLLPWQHQLNLLLEVSQVSEKDKIVLPLVRTCLKWREETRDRDVYLRFILATRNFHSIFGDMLEKVFERSKTIPAPKKFMTWLSQQDAELAEEFPNDRKFKGTVVTHFLLTDITEDQGERLMDVLVTSAETVDQASGNLLSIQDQQKTIDQISSGGRDQLFFIDKGIKETPGRTDMFFIDKGGSGGGECSKLVNDSEDESEADVAMCTEDIADVAMDTEDIADVDDEDNETEVYTIDTGKYNSEDKENSLVSNNQEMGENFILDDNGSATESEGKRKSQKSMSRGEVEETIISDVENKVSRRRSTRKSIKGISNEKTAGDKSSSRKTRKSVSNMDSKNDSKAVNQHSEEQESGTKTRKFLHLEDDGKTNVVKDSETNEMQAKVFVIDTEQIVAKIQNNSDEKNTESNEFDEKSPSIKNYSNYTKLRKRQISSKSDCEENLAHDMDYSLVIDYQGHKRSSEEANIVGNLKKVDGNEVTKGQRQRSKTISEGGDEEAVVSEKSYVRTRRGSMRLSESSEFVENHVTSKNDLTISESQHIGRSSRLSESSYTSEIKGDTNVDSKQILTRSRSKKSSISCDPNSSYSNTPSRNNAGEKILGNQETPRSSKRKRGSTESDTPVVNMDQSMNSQSKFLSPMKEHQLESEAKIINIGHEPLKSQPSSKKRRKSRTVNADDLVVPDSHGESDDNDDVIPDITRYSKYDLNSQTGNKKQILKGTTPSLAKKGKGIYEFDEEDGSSETEKAGEKKMKISDCRKDKEPSTPLKRPEEVKNETGTPKVLRKTRNSTGMTLRSKKV